MRRTPRMRSWSASERSQLPEVDRTTWRTRSAAELAGDVVAIAGGGLGEPVAEARGRGVDADLAAGLGVDRA